MVKLKTETCGDPWWGVRGRENPDDAGTPETRGRGWYVDLRKSSEVSKGSLRRPQDVVGITGEGSDGE